MKAKTYSIIKVIGKIHLYAGLFISPFVILYALTAVMFNHRLGTDPQAFQVTGQEDGLPVSVDNSLENLQLARSIMDQLGLRGEIDNVWRNDKSIDFPLSRPGELDNVHVDLETSTASIKRGKTGFAGALLYLHSRPGPHLVGIRGNWFWIRVWRALADITVYILLVLTISGPVVWLAMKQKRNTGLLVTVTGMLALGILLFLMTG